MIRLTLMKEWFDRVDVEGRSPIAELIAAPWFAGDTDAVVRCGPASSNIVCRVTAHSQTYYLRCNHESERTGDDYAVEMAFVEHLAAQGMRVARPVASQTGTLVEHVPTPLGIFHAVLLVAAAGTARELTEIDEPSLQMWGGTMASLHAAAEGYAGSGHPDWQQHLLFAKDLIPVTAEAAHRELAVIASALSALPMDATCFGLIHFDLEVDNMRWQDGMPTVFDFDDCAHYWFAADVAYALRDLYHDRIERIDLTDPCLRAFVAGYRAVRPLPMHDLQLLPLFMRADNLYWFARLHRSIAAGGVPGEPSWTTDLRATLVNTMNEFREGFERHPISPYLP
jgi:Ser/Thr protein kinase RdoA (MazF antagonist)